MGHNYPEVFGKKAEEIMVRNPMTVAPETPILEADSYMGHKNVRCILVVDHGNLVGMISICDIHRGLFLCAGVVSQSEGLGRSVESSVTERGTNRSYRSHN
jgi:CBS domain-containing protein